MPEGDTVWRTAQQLHEALAGRPLTNCDIRVPQWATVDLTGATVDEAVSRGKHLFVRAGDVSLHTHLKMEGAWHVYRLGEKWRRPSGEVRVLLEAGDVTAVGFSLGVVELIRTTDEDGIVAHLGPDLLGPDWDQDEALRRLRADPDRSITAALLDQRNLAGIGNMYKAEALFLAGVDPWTPVGETTDLAGVVDRAARLLELNKSTASQVTTGDKRRGREHWVYERRGKPCLRCGTPIATADQGRPPRPARRWPIARSVRSTSRCPA
jgi:endonuclease-8